MTLKIKKLHIKNFKSIADLEIIEPNPFTVFVGPNGSGKSNIFEALEFWNLGYKGYFIDLNSLFGGKKNMLHFNNFEQSANVSVEFANDNIIDSYAIVFPTDIGNQVLQNQCRACPLQETSVRHQ